MLYYIIDNLCRKHAKGVGEGCMEGDVRYCGDLLKTRILCLFNKKYKKLLILLVQRNFLGCQET